MPLNIAIKIGKKHIAKVKYIKFLGVLSDEKLTWKYHITELSKKLARTCGILFKVRCLLPRSILIMLHNALFLSFVQYGINALGSNICFILRTTIQTAEKGLSVQSLIKLFLHIPFQSLKI